jgi:mannose-1-phosphate guanylyltransferase
MKSDRSGHCWAFVLAGGEGRRLRALTTTRDGISIPKQFCSLHGGASLLRDGLERARWVASPEHIRAVVAASHRPWWSRILSRAELRQSVVQPANCGTASGVLLPLLKTLHEDPDGIVVVLPSDHHVDQEPILAQALRDAVGAAQRRPKRVLLLGIEPEEPDPELGYVVPGFTDPDGTAAVSTFVEKPDRFRAVDLIRRGALWNAFIVVARGSALLSLFDRTAPALVAQMHSALRYERLGIEGSRAIDELYQALAPLDFSHHICSGQEARLRIVKVPQCGWTDLGTPNRVAAALGRLPPAFFSRSAARCDLALLDLAEQQAAADSHPFSSVSVSASGAGLRLPTAHD